jgi:hypothetical protein
MPAIAAARWHALDLLRTRSVGRFVENFNRFGTPIARSVEDRECPPAGRVTRHPHLLRRYSDAASVVYDAR